MEILSKIVLVAWMVASFLLPRGADRARPGLAEWEIDGFDGLAIPLILGEDTVYAPGYSSTGFDRVEIGMERERVHDLLGRPLRTASNENGLATDWQVSDSWTYSPGSHHFRIRSVVYLHNRVIQKRGYLYFD